MKDELKLSFAAGPVRLSDLLLMFQPKQGVPRWTWGFASRPRQNGHDAYAPTPHPSICRREIAGENWCCSTSIRHRFRLRPSKWTITSSVCSHSRRSGFVRGLLLESGVSQYMCLEKCLINWSHFFHRCRLLHRGHFNFIHLDKTSRKADALSLLSWCSGHLPVS